MLRMIRKLLVLAAWFAIARVVRKQWAMFGFVDGMESRANLMKSYRRAQRFAGGAD
jgi:hypothetical protein